MEPILILGQPRSGTSMTAGIFAQHGVWTGTCREGNQFNEKGFFENLHIKKVIIAMQGRVVHAGVLGQPMPGFRAMVLAAIYEDGYRSGPWLWKGSALYWPAFYEFKAKIVVCRRPVGQIFDSCRSSEVIFGKELPDDLLRENIAIHHKQMDYLVDMGACEVDTWGVAQGDYDTIDNALEYCGIEFDHELTHAFVDSSLWKHE